MRSYSKMECRLTTRGRVSIVAGLPDRSANSERYVRHGLDEGGSFRRRFILQVIRKVVQSSGITTPRGARNRYVES